MAKTKTDPTSKAEPRRVSVSDLATLDQPTFGDRYILTCDGKEHAAVISLEELQAIETLENVLDLKEALRRIAARGKNISPEDVFKELAP